MYCDFDKNCKNKATRVLRLITIPKNECQKHLLYKRIVACEEHAEELCNNSELRYENLPNMKPEEVLKEQLIKGRNKR
jgi:hypothetical protein